MGLSLSPKALLIGRFLVYNAGMETPTKWVMLKQGRIRWHVRIMANNGKIVLSSQSYYSKSNADRAARKLADALGLSIYPEARK